MSEKDKKDIDENLNNNVEQNVNNDVEQNLNNDVEQVHDSKDVDEIPELKMINNSNPKEIKYKDKWATLLIVVGLVLLSVVAFVSIFKFNAGIA